MYKRQLIICHLIFLVAVRVLGQSSSIVYEENFSYRSRFLNNWKLQHGEQSEIDIIRDPTNRKNSCLFFNYLKDTEKKYRRAEIVRLNRHNTESKYNQEYKYSVRYYFPESYEFEKNPKISEIVTQWHHAPTKYGGPPPLALAIRKSKWEIWTHWGEPIEVNENGKKQFNKGKIHSSTLSDSISVRKNKWCQWTFQIKWNANGKGKIIVWYDDEKIIDMNNVSIGYKNMDNYMKMGFYKSAWYQKRRGESSVTVREMYIDDIKVESLVY